MDGHEIPALTVDAVILDAGEVLLIRRGRPPFEGAWALPGGFVEYAERVEDAARREAHEETGLQVALDALLGVYSDPDRDPRHHTVSIVFLARPAPGTDRSAVRGATDAAEAQWFPLDDLPSLAFDHERIMHDVREHLTA